MFISTLILNSCAARSSLNLPGVGPSHHVLSDIRKGVQVSVHIGPSLILRYLVGLVLIAVRLLHLSLLLLQFHFVIQEMLGVR